MQHCMNMHLNVSLQEIYISVFAMYSTLPLNTVQNQISVKTIIVTYLNFAAICEHCTWLHNGRRKEEIRKSAVCVSLCWLMVNAFLFLFLLFIVELWYVLCTVSFHASAARPVGYSVIVFSTFPFVCAYVCTSVHVCIQIEEFLTGLLTSSCFL